MQPIQQPTFWDNLGTLLGGLVLPRVYENYNRREGFKQNNYMKAQQASMLASQDASGFDQLNNMYNNQLNANKQEFTSWANKYNDAGATEAQRNEAKMHLNMLSRQIDPTFNPNSENAWTNVLNGLSQGNDARLQPLKNQMNAVGYRTTTNFDPNAQGAYDTVRNNLNATRDSYSNYKDSQKGKTVSGGTFQNISKYTASDPNRALWAGQSAYKDALSNPYMASGGKYNPNPMVIYVQR